MPLSNLDRAPSFPRLLTLGLGTALAIAFMAPAAHARRPRRSTSSDPSRESITPPEGLVGIVSESRHRDRRGVYLETASCTGFAIATWQGEQIATARHCIPQSNVPLTVYDGRRRAHAQSAVMPSSGPDVALVNSDPSVPFPTVQIADSESLQRGEMLCAWRVRTQGHSILWDRSCGRFLGHRVVDTGDGAAHDVILIEHALSPGFSGGPVMDSAGRVVGIGVAQSEGFDLVEPVEHLAELSSGNVGQPAGQDGVGVEDDGVGVMGEEVGPGYY